MIRKQSWVGGGQGREEGEGKKKGERNLIHSKREKEGGGGRKRERNLNFYLKSESSCMPGVVAKATAKKAIACEAMKTQ